MKRIVFGLLAMAVLVCALSVPVAAEDSSSPFIIVYKRFNSDGTLNDTVYRAPISESFLTSVGVYGIQITGFQFSPTIANGLDSVVFNFRVSGFISGETGAWTLSWPNGASFGTSDYATKIYCSYVASGRDTEPLVFGDTVYYPANNSAVFQLSYQTNNLTATTTNRFAIDLNTPMNIKPSGSAAGRAFWPYISDIHMQVGNGLANQFYLNSIDFTGSLSGFLFGSYSWMQISYDSDDESLVQTENHGNWFQAVLGLLQSATADMQAQAAEQERAKDAGAMDALDNAYERSSFGGLSDFADVDVLADGFDLDVLDNNADGANDWFSQTNKDWLDNVSRSRSDDNFVSFYSGHISDIIGFFGDDDSTARIILPEDGDTR